MFYLITLITINVSLLHNIILLSKYMIPNLTRSNSC